MYPLLKLFALANDRRGPKTIEFQQHLFAYATRSDADIHIARNIEYLLTSSNLHNVKQMYLSAPCGVWGGPAGRLLNTTWRYLFNDMKPRVLKVVPIEADEYEAIKEEVLAEMEQFYTYINWYVTCGQKPWTKSH
ncbi:hypothetical protein BC938DRAFT_475143 [Jimgerdemannia flammicorona]|uniref:Uncharacterized protein n=1 Tax=Jimgerdemannia flammicorona TaxID=994334 RepID=A0A433PZQ8_9FUNG|nr:hypothetical protein BC938DRAFT_475143 [Jimgerdemannia flammicorona]